MTEPIVIDIGTRLTMAGFAGEDFPRFVWPTVVGYPVDDTMVDSDSTKNFSIGQNALDSFSKRLVYPLKAGHIEDWDAIAAILESIFESLEVDPKDCRVLLTEIVFSPPKLRERLAQLLFHEFGVTHLYFVLRSALSLIATRKDSGIVIDFEPDYAVISPIFKRLAISHAIELLNPPTTSGLEISYLAERLVAAVENTDIDIHDTLYGNIVLTGSSTTTTGFKENLHKDIRSKITSERKISILDAPERLYLPWIGGSILAHLPSFIDAWVSYNEFSEDGGAFGRDI
jgi:actin-related protein